MKNKMIYHWRANSSEKKIFPTSCLVSLPRRYLLSATVKTVVRLAAVLS